VQSIHADSTQRVLLIQASAHLNVPTQTPEVLILPDGSRALVHSGENGIPQIWRKGEAWKIYFTELPVITIDAPEAIPFNKRRLKGTVESWNNDSLIESLHLEIWRRGSTSLSYPKPSFRLNLYHDMEYQVRGKGKLGADIERRKWILLAMTHEKLLFNNYIAYQLWNRSGGRRMPGVKPLPMNYVEVFYRGQYQGCYLQIPRPSEKELSTSVSSEGKVLVKVRTWQAGLFRPIDGLPPTKQDNQRENWAGTRELYPRNGEGLAFLEKTFHTVWSGKDPEFISWVTENFSLPNLVDLFLFVNLLNAQDNVGKNLFWFKPEQKAPYYAIPWDLDVVFGHYIPNSETDTSLRLLNTNRLLERLWEMNEPFHFKEKCKERWQELRKGPWQNDSVWTTFSETFHFLNKQRIYQRENLANPVFHYNPYWLNWYEYYFRRKVRFLDRLFKQV